MDVEFIRARITELRKKHGVSMRQMSCELERSDGYISNITSGKTLPSMQEFLNICDYFEITPQEFFSVSSEPMLVQQILDGIRALGEDDLRSLLHMVNRLLDKR